MKFLNWIKTLYSLPSILIKQQNCINTLQKEIDYLRNFCKDHTFVDVDVSMTDKTSTVIISGVYKNHDYVNIFHVHHNDIEELVSKLKILSKYHSIRHIDAYPTFSTYLKRELI